MARSLISLLVVCAASHALGQGFGRFGYNRQWDLPALKVTRAGFRVNARGAAEFRFEPKPPEWKPVETTPFGQVVVLKGPAIQKVRANLMALGFDVHVMGAFKLKVSTTLAPYLTWPEGSVGPGAPTPVTKWIIASFRDSQPPVAIGFEGPPAALQVDGVAGEWTISTTKPYAGWIRISAPLGLTPLQTNGAAELGEMAAKCAASLREAASPPPRILGQKIEADANGVQWEMTLDRKGAVIPSCWTLAPLAGFRVSVAGEPRATPIVTEDGPQFLSSIPTLRARFPVKRAPLGRSLAVGEAPYAGVGTTSFLHIPGIVELAFSLLTCRADAKSKEAARGALDAFFESAPYVVEPFTKQRFPYPVSGDGVDVAAAQALLMQCLQNGEAAPDSTNSLLTSLSYRRDWNNGLFTAPATAPVIRCGALAALAGAFSPDPERRLDGALFEAGVAARSGLKIWLKRRGLAPSESQEPQPMREFRSNWFGYGLKPTPSPFGASLMSGGRLTGQRAYVVTKTEKGYCLSASSEDLSVVRLTIHSSNPITFAPNENVATLVTAESFGDYVVQISLKEAGPFSILVEAPNWAEPWPKFVPPVTYSEQ